MRWRKTNDRPPKTFKEGFQRQRRDFAELLLALGAAGFRILAMDEYSTNSTVTKRYNWQCKYSESFHIQQTK